MSNRFTQFASRLLGETGTKLLTDDLGEVSSSTRYINLGGGNPALIPEMAAIFRKSMLDLIASGEFDKLIATYESPQGNRLFIRHVKEFLVDTLNWNINESNIVITNGSQSSFFMLFNLYAGLCADGVNRSVLLPMTPEYISYGDLLMTRDSLVSCLPQIDRLDDEFFKYSINFSQVKLTEETGVVCVSRPSNPSGNVVTNDEINRLSLMAQEVDVPLIIDSAYGQPFPQNLFKDVSLPLSLGTIHCFSLSKLGLAGLRTGIIVANESTVSALKCINAITNLSVNAVGSLLVDKLIKSKTILKLSREIIGPFYQKRRDTAIDLCRHYFRDLEVFIHKPEGAFFLWLWIPNLPISAQQLYERIKSRGVLVIPGNHFFPGVPDTWEHKNQCLRVSYVQEIEQVEKGVQIISDEIRKSFKS